MGGRVPLGFMHVFIRHRQHASCRFQERSSMHRTFLPRGEVASTIPVWFVNAANWREHRDSLDAPARAFTDAAGFEPTPGRHFLIPSEEGGIARVLFAIEEVADSKKDFFRPGALADLLPPGTYRFANAPHDTRLAALAFALGCYQFTRYRQADANGAKLVVPDGVDGDDISRIAEGVALARDLINTPANDMGPADLEQAARDLAAPHGASVRVIVGD